MSHAQRIPARRAHRRHRGAALLWSLTALVLIAGTIAASSDRKAAFDRMTAVEFSAEGQARSLAQAGLVDAYAWFRRQATQPVSTFAPVLDPKAQPPLNETDDPSVGLVREFELAPGIWGRYIVRHGTPGEPYVDDNVNGRWDAGEDFADQNLDGTRTPGKWTRDVTHERGLTGHGAVWQLEARGEVFRRSRQDLALGEGPNHRLGVARLATEIRRLTIVPPGDAAICATDSSLVVVRENARIRGKETETGGSVGVAAATGYVKIRSGGEILADVNNSNPPWYDDSFESIFGVDWTELKAMSDITTSDPSTIQGHLPDYGIVTVEGDLVFNEHRPLRGTAVLAVQGDVTIKSGSNSFFGGVLYVSGDLRIQAPAFLRGTIIAKGKVILEGQADLVEVEHDPDMVSRLLQVAGQYRFSKAIYTPARLLDDGRPSSTVGPNVGQTKEVFEVVKVAKSSKG